jgi:hypothetical protein
MAAANPFLIREHHMQETIPPPPRIKPFFIGSGILWGLWALVSTAIYFSADWWNPIPFPSEILEITQRILSLTVIVTIGTFGLFLNVMAALVWFIRFSMWAHRGFKILGY